MIKEAFSYTKLQHLTLFVYWLVQEQKGTGRAADCASPGSEALRKLQVIDTFLLAAIDCLTYLFSFFTVILIVVVYW